MKKIVVVLLSILVAISLCLGLGSKTDEEMIIDRMHQFARAYNSGDMEEAIGCMDSKSRNAYMAAMRVGNAFMGLTGVNIEMADLFSLGIAVAEEGEPIKFADLEVEMTSETDAKVHALMYFAGHGEQGDKITFYMVKENDDWYLDGGV